MDGGTTTRFELLRLLRLLARTYHQLELTSKYDGMLPPTAVARNTTAVSSSRRCPLPSSIHKCWRTSLTRHRAI